MVGGWKEIFYVKELGKNLVQHRADERILKYELEVYQKIFFDFINGSQISKEVSN